MVPVSHPEMMRFQITSMTGDSARDRTVERLRLPVVFFISYFTGLYVQYMGSIKYVLSGSCACISSIACSLPPAVVLLFNDREHK